MKEEFLSIVSHELRTPLGAILGYSQLLQMGQVNPDEIADTYRAIERNGKAQIQIIDDLLDMSRIIAGKIRLDVRPVQLSEVVEAAVATIRPAAAAKNIHLQQVLDPSSGLPLGDNVLGDFDRLQQVLRNILSNAVKFTPKGGRIQISLERVSSHLELGVADTGVGIPPDFLPHVFDRFRQADGATTRRHGGLGLGLAIVKQIVELHGGTVTADSRGENQGSTFTIALPLQAVQSTESDRVHPQAETDFSAPFQVPDLAGIKVLVVDDEPDARDVIRRVLSGKHAEVTLASSADEALEILKHFRPDVLLSDVGMPEKDGYQFIQEIRAKATFDGGNIPAVALTAFVRTEDRRRALLSGYQSHLAKPVDPGELIAVVAMLAGRTKSSSTDGRA